MMPSPPSSPHRGPRIMGEFIRPNSVTFAEENSACFSKVLAIVEEDCVIGFCTETDAAFTSSLPDATSSGRRTGSPLGCVRHSSGCFSVRATGSPGRLYMLSGPLETAPSECGASLLLARSACSRFVMRNSRSTSMAQRTKTSHAWLAYFTAAKFNGSATTSTGRNFGLRLPPFPPAEKGLFFSCIMAFTGHPSNFTEDRERLPARRPPGLLGSTLLCACWRVSRTSESI
mmetsp:Transcript_153017/g.264899  ORF Transcript_153017/g.264899 Transcript_153017/m.264899 type:complete len:230 (+) Transcript_153017:814-1503(+)